VIQITAAYLEKKKHLDARNASYCGNSCMYPPLSLFCYARFSKRQANSG
jgi:hypothetical protein